MPKLIVNGQFVFAATEPADFAALLLTMKPDVQVWPLRYLDDDGNLLFEANSYDDFCRKIDFDPEPVRMAA